MKTLKTLVAIALSAAGLGSAVTLGVVSGQQELKPLEKAEAASATVYVDISNSDKFKQDGTLNCYYWGGSSSPSWPGEAMSAVSEYSNLYSLSIPSDTTGIVFNLNGWGGDCQTNDLTFDSSKPLFTISTNNTNGSKQDASKSIYQQTIYVLDINNSPLSVTQKAHIWNEGGSSAASTSWPGVNMTKVGGSSSHIYSLKTLGNINRVIFNNNQGQKTGNLSIDGECSVLKSDWDGTKWISLEGAQFIDGYMHFHDIPMSNTGSTANCVSHYNDAKIAYNALSSNNIRKEVLGVDGVSARLSAWATANGGSIDSSGGALNSSFVYPITENKGITVVLITALTIAISTIGAFFLLRRKGKEQ